MTSPSWKFHKMSPIKFNTKRIFRIFGYWKLTELHHFVTYLWYDPHKFVWVFCIVSFFYILYFIKLRRRTYNRCWPVTFDFMESVLCQTVCTCLPWNLHVIFVCSDFAGVNDGDTSSIRHCSQSAVTVHPSVIYNYWKCWKYRQLLSTVQSVSSAHGHLLLFIMLSVLCSPLLFSNFDWLLLAAVDCLIICQNWSLV